MPARRPSTSHRSAHGRHHAARRMALFLLSGLILAASATGAAHAQSAPIARPAAVDPFAAHITEAAQRFGIPGRWIRAVLRAESAGDVRAISSAGALGLMQVMPDTWAGLRVRYRLGRDPFDPRDNIMAGAAYLREMWDRYGDVGAMLAAYNAGPGRYDDHRSTGRALPPETRTYVAALVPVLGGAAAPETSIQRADPPPDWREAAIFVVRSADARSAAPRSANERSDDSRSPVTARPSDPAATSDSPLVVARSTPGDRP